MGECSSEVDGRDGVDRPGTAANPFSWTLLRLDRGSSLCQADRYQGQSRVDGGLECPSTTMKTPTDQRFRRRSNLGGSMIAFGAVRFGWQRGLGPRIALLRRSVGSNGRRRRMIITSVATADPVDTGAFPDELGGGRGDAFDFSLSGPEPKVERCTRVRLTPRT